ncbi:hypothetical protein PROFUN_05404 [Planoprotostelium fungivorum]|uniref:Uncharacterized protein n=1 Tax=Planoprotostelium fungivorum TaxID=1890364 RepID=A0A2P6NQM6_9EUKA|nr:hypothetical protein PROFUN_05404 [Planoprotostelium fungivorum]
MDQQSLLGGEDLQLAILEKNEILRKMNNQWTLRKYLFDISCFHFVCLSGGLIATAVITRILIPFLIFLVGSVALGLASWIVTFPWKKSVSKHQEEAARLLEENYVGSWKFEPQTWRDFVKHHFQWKEKLMWIAIVLIVSVAPMDIILFVSLEKIADLGIIISIAVTGCLCASALIIFTFLYPCLRSYSPTVHCCVLGRGSVYTLGTMYSLQPATEGPDFTAYSLMSVNLQEKMMDTTVLRLETKTKDNVKYLLIEAKKKRKDEE